MFASEARWSATPSRLLRAEAEPWRNKILARIVHPEHLWAGAIILKRSFVRFYFSQAPSSSLHACCSHTPRRNVHDATSRAKDPKPAPRLQQVPPELATPTDLGSLWDEGPAYD